MKMSIQCTVYGLIISLFLCCRKRIEQTAFRHFRKGVGVSSYLLNHNWGLAYARKYYKILKRFRTKNPCARGSVWIKVKQ